MELTPDLELIIPPEFVGEEFCEFFMTLTNIDICGIYEDLYRLPNLEIAYIPLLNGAPAIVLAFFEKLANTDYAMEVVILDRWMWPQPCEGTALTRGVDRCQVGHSLRIGRGRRMRLSATAEDSTWEPAPHGAVRRAVTDPAPGPRDMWRDAALEGRLRLSGRRAL